MIEHCVHADDVTALGEDKGAIFQVRKFGFIFRSSLFSVGDCIYKAYDRNRQDQQKQVQLPISCHIFPFIYKYIFFPKQKYWTFAPKGPAAQGSGTQGSAAQGFAALGFAKQSSTTQGSAMQGSATQGSGVGYLRLSCPGHSR